MADEGKVCVCPQCGKKYRLKEGFDAKSFSCKACGATVWVAGKPPAPAPTTGRPAAAPAAAQGGGRGGRTAVAASRGAGRKPRGSGERHAGTRGSKSRIREKKGMSKGAKWVTVGLVAGGLIALLGSFMASTPPAAPGDAQPGVAAATTGAPAEKPPVQAPAPNAGTATPTTKETPPKETAPVESDPPPEDGEAQKPKLGGDPKKGEKGKSKWDPPANLGHLETTPPEMRKQIDDWIALVVDTQAGRDSLDAKAKLAATGKPAFLPILGSMANIRDTIADTDSMEERLIESSLKLADECLREMDGYLDAHDKAPIRPGTEKNYIEYVLRIHYRRWMDGMGSQPLKDMDAMPGPFDPTTMQKVTDKDEEEEEEDEKGAGKKGAGK